jgi:non-specific protein-tyrosine kinase
VECRHCGAPVAVEAQAPPEAAPEPEKAEAAVGDFETLVADICEPGGGGAVPPLPDGLLAPREPLRKVARPVAPLRPKEPRMKESPPAPAPRKEDAPTAPEAPAAKAFEPPSGPTASPAAPPPAKPKEPARPARTIPAYTVSRSVVLDPETLVENRVAAFFPDAPALEAYRVLRTRILQAAAEKGGNTVMITSALPLEGKTLTAVNLALTFSKTYLETALLVDCDLRQQKVHKTLGYESDKGLGDYVTDGCSVSDMFVWPGVDKLTVISGGRTVSESSEFLGSPLLKELVEDMKGRYENRYIFFDVPSVLAGADALAFAPLVDHILFVVRAGATPLPEVQRALRMLPREKVIGLVLNRQAEA